MGGHSLLAVKLATVIDRALSIQIKIAQVTVFLLLTINECQIMNYPSVEQLSHFITTNNLMRESTPIPIIQRNENFDLSYHQERLWLLDQMNPGSSSYNVTFITALLGNFV